MSYASVLGNAAARWLDPTSPIRHEGIAALQVSTGYSKLQIAAALNAAFGEATAFHLERYARDLRPPVQPLTVLHIAAGNVFTSWLHGAIITVLMGHRAWIKPSSREPVFASLWTRSVIAEDAALMGALRVVHWNEDLLRQVNAVVAYGSDDTLALLREKAAGLPFAGYGHKISVAVVFQEAQDPASAWIAAAHRDIDAFALEGCLSPQVVYVEGKSDAFEKAVKLRPISGPWPRFILFQSPDDVPGLLRTYGSTLSCVGVAGAPDRLLDVSSLLADTPAVRVCALGDMQRPPLTWKNGGLDFREFLLK